MIGPLVSCDQPPSCDQAPALTSAMPNEARMSRIYNLSAPVKGALVPGLAADDDVGGDFLAAAGSVVLAEAVLQHVLQTEVFLAHEAGMASAAVHHQVDDCRDAGRGR